MPKKFRVAIFLIGVILNLGLVVYLLPEPRLNEPQGSETGTGKVYVCIIYSGGDIVFLEKSKKDNASDFVGYGVPKGTNIGYGGVELLKRTYIEGDPELDLMVDYDAALEVISYTEKLENHLENKR